MYRSLALRISYLIKKKKYITFYVHTSRSVCIVGRTLSTKRLSFYFRYCGLTSSQAAGPQHETKYVYA